nr:glycosyltransferase [uncultured Capnocytophaga sp.]
MPNIGFVHGRFPYGGGEKITSNIAPYLTALGYKVFVFSSHIAHQELTDEDKQYITFVDIGKTRLFSRPNVSLADKVKELGIDVLAFIGKSFSASGEGIFKKTQCKCIFAHYGATFWQSENELENLKQKAKKSLLHFLYFWGFKIPSYHLYRKIRIEKYRAIYKHYHAFTVLCEAYKDELTQALQLTDNHKLKAISTPIPSVSTPYSLQKENVLLYVGRMSYKDKRVDRLVSIWEMIYEQFPDWQFFLVGDGKELPKLRAMVEERSLPRITFVGKTDDIYPYYNEAAINCLSSQIEGFPLMLIEAQQAGVIPVAFACSAGVREILSPDAENGRLIPPFDLDAYAEALATLMSDEPLRKQMQQNVLKKARLYNIEEIVKQWDSLFKKIL